MEYKQKKTKDINYFKHFFSEYANDSQIENHLLGKIEKKIKIKNKNNFFVFEYKPCINTKIDISIIDYNLKKNKLKFIIYKKNIYQIFIYIFFSTTIEKDIIKDIEKYLNNIKINDCDTIKLLDDIQLPFFNQKLKINYFLKNKKHYYFDDFNKLICKNIINLNCLYDYIEIEKKKITNFIMGCNIKKIKSLKRTYYTLEHNTKKIFLNLDDLISQQKLKKKILCNLGYFLSNVQKNKYKSCIESIVSKLDPNELTYLNKKKIIKNIFSNYLKENLNLSSCGDNIANRKLMLKGYPVIQFYRYGKKRKKCVCFKFNLFMQTIQDKIVYYNLKQQDFYNEFEKNNFIPVLMNIYLTKSKIKKVKIHIIPLDFMSISI